MLLENAIKLFHAFLTEVFIVPSGWWYTSVGSCFIFKVVCKKCKMTRLSEVELCSSRFSKNNSLSIKFKKIRICSILRVQTYKVIFSLHFLVLKSSEKEISQILLGLQKISHLSTDPTYNSNLSLFKKILSMGTFLDNFLSSTQTSSYFQLVARAQGNLGLYNWSSSLKIIFYKGHNQDRSF